LTPSAVVTAFIAGAIASVAGFGIGSVLTPVLATQLDVRLAIAAVSLPHLVGTFVRFLLVRTHIDRDVLFGFGAASAVGGLTGAALQSVVQSAALAIIFGALLIFAGAGSLNGLAQRMRFRGRVAALIGGAVSGLLGGLGAYTLARALSWSISATVLSYSAPYLLNSRPTMKSRNGALTPLVFHETAVSTPVVEGPSACTRSVRHTFPTIGKSICMV